MIISNLRLTSDGDGVVEDGWVEWGYLAGIVACVALVGERHEQRVAELSALEAVLVAVADHLRAHSHDRLAVPPDQHEALWKIQITHYQLYYSRYRILWLPREQGKIVTISDHSRKAIRTFWLKEIRNGCQIEDSHIGKTLEKDGRSNNTRS